MAPGAMSMAADPAPAPRAAGDADDAAAIAAWVEQGDRDALQTVFARHAPAALRLAAHRLGNHSDADDAVQHAFIGVMRSARSFRPEAGTVRGWLLASVLNACAHQRRSDGSRRAREAGPPPPTPEPGDPDLRDAMLEALSQLPEHQRRAVELRYLAGLDFPEIAAALGRNERTVRGQVTRGLERLRDICARLGLAAGTASPAVVLASLPQPALPAGAVERCVAIAASGPPAARRKPWAYAAVVLALAVALLGWRLLPGPARDAPPVVTSANGGAAAPAAAARELRDPWFAWRIADDATTMGLPIVAIGSARPLPDTGTRWWEAPTAAMRERSSWGPLPDTGDQRHDWLPERMLGPPRIGEPAWLVAVSQASVDGDVLACVPLALRRDPDGWTLTLEGLRVPPTAFPDTMKAERGAFALPLGLLGPGDRRLRVELATRTMPTLAWVLPEAAELSRGTLELMGVSPVASLGTLVPAGSSGSATPPLSRWWQVPLASAPVTLAADGLPTEPDGLAGAEGPVADAFRAAGRTLGATTVLVLGPRLADADEISLRSVRWDGATAHATVAVWQRDTAADSPSIRQILPIRIERPPGLVGDVVVTLAWERWRGTPDGAFERIGAPAAEPGVTQLLLPPTPTPAP